MKLRMVLFTIAMTAVIFFAGLSAATMHDRLRLKIELARIQAKCEGDK